MSRYAHIGRGFFDDNPGWTRDRDTFWLLFSQPKRPSSLLLAAALRDAEDATRERVLTWLLAPDAPVQRVFGRSRDEFTFHLFRSAAKLDAVPLMRQIMEMERTLKLDDPRVPGLLGEMIAAGRAQAAEVLMGPLRNYNEELLYACEKKHVAMVRLLLREGRVNPAWHNSICLIQACNVDSADIVSVLLADNRVKPSDRAYSALEEAIANQNRDSVEMLLEADARISLPGLQRMLTRYSVPPDFAEWTMIRWQGNQPK